jgi:hypothetical protein
VGFQVLANGQYEIQWVGSGAAWLIEGCASLVEGDWQPLIGPVTGTAWRGPSAAFENVQFLRVRAP